MPVVLKLTHTDDTTEEIRLPAEVWVRNSEKVSRLVVSQGEIKSVELDPHLESADTNRSNNYYPPQIGKSRFQLYRDKKAKNEMQNAGLGKKDDGSETDKANSEAKQASGDIE